MTAPELHEMDPAAFHDEVHSFSFWFDAVRGYLEEASSGIEPGEKGQLEPGERDAPLHVHRGERGGRGQLRLAQCLSRGKEQNQPGCNHLDHPEGHRRRTTTSFGLLSRVHATPGPQLVRHDQLGVPAQR